MPSYTFECKSCNVEVAKSLTFAQYQDVTSSNQTIPCGCLAPMALVFKPTALKFGLKEGPAGGWVTKALKEQSYRDQHRITMGQRQRDHVNPHKLVPNYKGQEGNNWAEVQSHVRAESGNLAASTYDPLVVKEKSS